MPPGNTAHLRITKGLREMHIRAIYSNILPFQTDRIPIFTHCQVGIQGVGTIYTFHIKPTVAMTTENCLRIIGDAVRGDS